MERNNGEKYLFSNIREPKNDTFRLRMFKTEAEKLEAELNKKHLGKGEVFALNGKAFGQGSWQCVTGTYRTMFITSVLFAGFNYEEDIVSKMVAITIITSIFEFLIYPIAGMLVSRTNTKIGRYRPFGLLISIPISIAGALMFVSPPGFELQQKIIYIIIVTCAFNFLNIFMNLAYNLVQVNTPNSKERGKWLAFAGIIQTVGSVVPMVLFKILALFLPEASIFTVLGILFASMFLFTNLAFFILCKERVAYSPVKIKITTGLLKPFKYKPFLILQFANQVRTFAGLTGVTTPFLAAVVLGTENAILFSLPTGVGTVVGLLLCNLMMKKIKPLYMMRGIGIYSFIVAAAATIVGPFAGIPFYILYFMYGITYGFHNVLPHVISADVFDYLEWKTGQRLEATSGIIMSYIGKGVYLLRDTLFVLMLAWAGYKIPAVGQTIYQANEASRQSVGNMLMLYAVGIPGFFFLIVSVIYFFFDLEGKNKEEMHKALREMRAGYAQKTSKTPL